MLNAKFEQFTLFNGQRERDSLPQGLKDFLNRNCPALDLGEKKDVLEVGSLGFPSRDFSSIEGDEGFVRDLRQRTQYLASTLKISELFATWLSLRGFFNAASAHQFISADLPYWLDSSARLENIGKAADQIADAIRNRNPVAMFGDVDIDGTTALAVWVPIFRYLETPLFVRQWDRKTESYGFTESQLAWAEQTKASLLVTLDLGTNDAAVLQRFSQPSITVDHHIVQSQIPAVFINPFQSNTTLEFRSLAAAPLSALLLHQVNLRLGSTIPDVLMRDAFMFGGMGQIVDQAPLRGPGRAFASFALEHLPLSTAPGIVALRDELRSVHGRASSFSFGIGPTLGSLLRLYGRDTKRGEPSATMALSCLVCEEDETAERLVALASSTNRERQRREDECYQKACRKVKQTYQVGDRAQVVFLKEDYSDVAGPVASKLCDTFGLLIIVVSERADGTLVFSGRTKGDVSFADVIPSILPACVKAGGHAPAAGGSVRRGEEKEFTRLVLETVKRLNASTVETITPDFVMTLREFIDHKNELLTIADEIEPTGKANQSVLVRIDDIFITKAICDKRQHVALTLSDGTESINVNAFHQNLDLPWLARGKRGLLSVQEGRYSVLVTPDRLPWEKSSHPSRAVTAIVKGISLLAPPEKVAVLQQANSFEVQRTVSEGHANVFQALGGEATLFSQLNDVPIPKSHREFEQRFYEKDVFRLPLKKRQIGILSRYFVQDEMHQLGNIHQLDAGLGSGKTAVGLGYCAQSIARGGRAVYFVRNDGLAQQALQEALKFLNLDLEKIGVLTGSIPKNKRHVEGKSFVIATVHEWLANNRKLDEFDTFIFDEAHNLRGNDPGAKILDEIVKTRFENVHVLLPSGTSLPAIEAFYKRQKRFRPNELDRLESSSPRRNITSCRVPLENDMAAIEQHVFAAGKSRYNRALTLVQSLKHKDVFTAEEEAAGRAVILKVAALLNTKRLITPMRCRLEFPPIKIYMELIERVRDLYHTSKETLGKHPITNELGRCVGLLAEAGVAAKLREYITSSSSFLMLHQTARAMWQSTIPESKALGRNNKTGRSNSWKTIIREIRRPLRQLAAGTPYEPIISWFSDYYYASAEELPQDGGRAFITEHAPQLLATEAKKEASAYDLAKRYLWYAMKKTARMPLRWEHDEELLSLILTKNPQRTLIPCHYSIEARYLAERIPFIIKQKGGQQHADWVAGKKFMSAKRQTAIISESFNKQNGILAATETLQEGSNLNVDNIVFFAQPKNLLQFEQFAGRGGRFSGSCTITLLSRTGCRGGRLTVDEVRAHGIAARKRRIAKLKHLFPLWVPREIS